MKANELAKILLENPNFDVVANVVYYNKNIRRSTKLEIKVCKENKAIYIF